MFYYLSQYILENGQGTVWGDALSFMRVFSYVTFRSAGAAITALLVSLWMGPKVIAWLKRIRFSQEYVDRAEEAGGRTSRSSVKQGTPTMGGILIVLVIDISAILWTRWNSLVVLTLLSLVVLAALGFYDDYLKVTHQTGSGARLRLKLWVQFGLAIFIGLYLWRVPETERLVSDIMVPFHKYPVLQSVPIIGLVLAALTIVGSSNAVNVTDGLDGLAIGCTVIVTTVFLVMTYIAGHRFYAEYLQVPYVSGASELAVVCSAMLGAGLGFLWFNCHPAQVFMGDTGSLALGGVLGIMAVLIHQPLVLVIAGGVFVVEAVSVLMQTSYFKYTRRRTGVGKRIFLIAPLHHHFEKKGWHESQVVMRFYILSVLCAVLALVNLKLR